MKNQITLCICLFLATICTINAQVKIGNNPNTINANSLLELESTTKGFLAPRVAINDLNSVSPLTATTPAGMLVYSSGGSVTDGFYNWNGSKWIKLTSSSDLMSTITKTANASLLKTDAFVLASNDITLTLPAITSADNGIAISVKNIGTYTDLITIVGNGAAKIDDENSYELTRWQSINFTAYEGNWLIYNRVPRTKNILDVSCKGSWQTIDEVIAFLNDHMTEPMVVRLCGEVFPISSTQIINLPYSVTFEGLSSGTSTIQAAAGVYGNPLFECKTTCNFKMITFMTFAGTAGNIGLLFPNSGTYHEIKECTFYGFNKGIHSTSNHTNLNVFSSAFVNNAGAAIEITEGSASNGVVVVTQCLFSQCKIGINLLSGVSQSVSLFNNTFINTTAGTDIGILYTPATFTSFKNIFISSNSWNNQGTYISGFDFSRSDGRDANAFIVNNLGMENQNPSCKINVSNNLWTTTLASNLLWYHANFVNGASSSTCKWKLEDNKITYLPSNANGAWAMITGNIAVNNANRVITIAICKNGSTLVRYGETDLRITVANQPFQFSTIIYIPDLVKNDYLEVAVKATTSGDVVTFQDVQWFTNTK
jgi:hypothetical protein